MERRFDVRLEELLDDAVLDGRIPEGMLERLKEFVAPFAACLLGSKQQRHIWEYVSGLFSDVKRKNAETIGVQETRKGIGRRRSGPEGVLVILREVQSDGTMKHDYYLSNALFETTLSEFARVAKAEHRIEECLERAKSDAGLAQCQVRNWIGWHHHQTLYGIFSPRCRRSPNHWIT